MTGPFGWVDGDGHVRLPRRRGEVIDEVNRLDRETFEANPGRLAFVRPYVPGEFFPAPEDEVFPMYGDRYVEVTLVGPGLRTRRPFVARLA